MNGIEQSQDEKKWREAVSRWLRKKWVIISGFTLIMLLTAFFLLQEPYYTNNPAKWIDEVYETKIVNVGKVTVGKGEITRIGISYQDTVFEFSGIYKGKEFTTQHKENEEIKIRITNELIPGDGILDGIIIERKETDGSWTILAF